MRGPLRHRIAEAERSRKISGIRLSELERLWAGQVTEAERQSLSKVARQTAPETPVNRLPVAEGSHPVGEKTIYSTDIPFCARASFRLCRLGTSAGPTIHR